MNFHKTFRLFFKMTSMLSVYMVMAEQHIFMIDRKHSTSSLKPQSIISFEVIIFNMLMVKTLVWISAFFTLIKHMCSLIRSTCSSIQRKCVNKILPKFYQISHLFKCPSKRCQGRVSLNGTGSNNISVYCLYSNSNSLYCLYSNFLPITHVCTVHYQQ